MKPLLVLLVIAVAVCALGFVYIQIDNRLNQMPVVREAWTNAFIKCPTEPDYGELMSRGVPMWEDFPQLEFARDIPHGTKIALLTDDPNQRGTYRVRVDGDEGYVPASLITDYDPADGVQPDRSLCAE